MTTTALSRLELTRLLIGLLHNDEAVVAGIGNTNFDLAAVAGDRPQNFPMLGSMGLATSIGLGVALAQPDRRVIALEGDGSLLMNLGSLATIAALAPANLTVIIWVNGAYQITGNQPAATADATDVVAVARGAGIESSAWLRDEADFARSVERALQTPGPHFLAARIDQSPGTGRPERDPVILKDRFVRGIGAKQ